MTEGWRGRLERLDAAVYRGERAAGWLFVAMTAVVFAEVVHRVGARRPGRLAVILGDLFDTDPVGLDARTVPVLIGLVGWFIVYSALRTRQPSAGTAPMSRRRAMVYGMALAGGGGVALQVLLALRPEGFVWAPYFALAALLWTGLLGASMATYRGRHLALEMGEKLWPERARPTARALGNAVTGLFSLLIVALGSLSVHDHFAAWSASPQAALIPSLDWPKWAVFAIVPWGFLVMSARFLGRATGLLPQPVTEELR